MKKNGNNSYALTNQLPGAQRDTDEIEEDEGHGAAMLSLKSHIKLMPVTLSKITSEGKLLSRHPAFEQNQSYQFNKNNDYQLRMQRNSFHFCQVHTREHENQPHTLEHLGYVHLGCNTLNHRAN